MPTPANAPVTHTHSTVGLLAGVLVIQPDAGVVGKITVAEFMQAILADYPTSTQLVSYVDTAVAGCATSAQGATADSVASIVAGYGDIITHTATDFATAAQGVKADSALQDGSAFATAAQGAKADTALQPASDGGFTGTATNSTLSFVNGICTGSL